MYLRLFRASIFAKCKNVWWSRPKFETQLKIEFLLPFTSSSKALKITVIYIAISDLPTTTLPIQQIKTSLQKLVSPVSSYLKYTLLPMLVIVKVIISGKKKL